MKKDFAILGIESTCDETSAALLVGGKKLLSNVIYSQIEEHKKYHGVVPELASRAHAAKIAAVIDQALGQHDIDCVAFAHGPGLPGGLMVGRVAAQTLAKFKKTPILGINHLEGHLFACEFENGEVARPLEFPLVALIVSGGHTELWYVKGYGDYKVLGRPRDDAAGEAFDKVARVIGLGYPGGPKVDAAAKEGNDKAFDFPRAKTGNDFSFSGLKTAVINTVHKMEQKGEPVPQADIAASFQRAVVDVLTEKTIHAAKISGSEKICLAGGVASNSLLRSEMAKKAKSEKIEVYYPPLRLCTDNAVMISSAGYFKYKYTGETAGNDLNAYPALSI